MEWWQWVAAAVEAVLLTILLLLWFDTLRDRQGWTWRQAARRPLLASPAVPIGFVVVLLVPLWLGLILIAIPALAVIVMAMAT